MGLNLKVFSANYKLCATNYKVNGASHDDKILRATAPFINSTRPHKPIAVKVNHVIWFIGNPNFGFPS